MSKKWSGTTKRSVVVGLVLTLALIVYRFSSIIPPLAVAIVLAYILDPPVEFIRSKTKLPRTWAVASVYLALMAVLGLALAAFVPSLIQEVMSINVDFQSIVESVSRFFEQPIYLFGFYVDLLDVYKEVSSTLQDIISPLASRTVSFLIGLASSLGWAIFIAVISFYLLKDMDKLSHSFYDLVPADYRHEVRRLMEEIDAIWNAFFRAQIVLCLVVGGAVGAALWVVGVKNALVLGIVAGILEIVPNIGPVISAIPAVLIAYFQGSTRLPLSNFWFALLVIGLYVIIQQVENNFLVPRIIGRRLNLHPLVVIIGAIAGASLAGILGIFLAAPTLATLRVLARYIYCKLLDLDPFPEEAEEPSEPAEQER